MLEFWLILAKPKSQKTMASSRTLFERVSFEKRTNESDGGGGTKSTWIEQFQCRAEYTHLRGGEAVQAARLQGKHTQVVTVRKSTLSGSVSTDWRIRDVRTNEIYNIRDREPETNRMYISFTCERGVAA